MLKTSLLSGLISMKSNKSHHSLLTVMQFQFSSYRKQKFVHIYPKDNVLVKPLFGNRRNLSLFDRKNIAKDEKLKEMNKVQVGKVIRVLRNKNQVIIAGVNKKVIYKPASSYLASYEGSKMQNIRPKVIYQPVDLNRVRLRDMNSEDVRPLDFRIQKVENPEDKIDSSVGNGEMYRVAKNTGEIITRHRPNKSYDKRMEKKETGPFDTDAATAREKTYRGEALLEVAREFLNRIKEKKQVESLLFLKDK